MLAALPLFVVAALDSLSRPDDLAVAVAKTGQHYLKTVDQTMPHVEAALAAETKLVSAEVLLSIAYYESRYLPEATSYVIGGKRRARIPRWARRGWPPRGVGGPYFCGVTQVAAKKSWKRCLELRDVPTAYAIASAELTNWLKACRRHKNRMRCALTGYGGGYPAIERGTSTYPSRVLNRARLLLRKAAVARKMREGQPLIGEIRWRPGRS
jgi:hypothetical protein